MVCINASWLKSPIEIKTKAPHLKYPVKFDNICYEYSQIGDLFDVNLDALPSVLLPRQAQLAPAAQAAAVGLAIRVAFKAFQNVVRLKAQGLCALGSRNRANA
jgi:hypothetical protein